MRVEQPFQNDYARDRTLAVYAMLTAKPIAERASAATRDRVRERCLVLAR